MFIHETWTGGEHFWIQYKNGTHVLLRETCEETCECESESEIVFTGHYEKCLEELERIVEANFEYDFNI